MYTGRKYSGNQAYDFLPINLKKITERLRVEEKVIQVIWITEFGEVRHLDTRNSGLCTDRNGRKMEAVVRVGPKKWSLW